MSRTKLIANAVAGLLEGGPAAAAARAALAADAEERKTPRERLVEALAEVKLAGSHFAGIRWEVDDGMFAADHRTLRVRLRWLADRRAGHRDDYAKDWLIPADYVDGCPRERLQRMFRDEVYDLVRYALKQAWAVTPGEPA